jgi:hypothetical protein
VKELAPTGKQTQRIDANKPINTRHFVGIASERPGKQGTADEVHIEGRRLFRKRRDASVDDGAMLNRTAGPEER